MVVFAPPTTKVPLALEDTDPVPETVEETIGADVIVDPESLMSVVAGVDVVEDAAAPA